MAKVNPYLTFNGNCEEAMNFYRSVFKTEFVTMVRFKDFPKESNEMPENTLNQIMHAALPIGKETMLMACDSPRAFPPVAFGQHLSLSVSADSKEEADQLFNGLAQGGRIAMPMDNTFWGAYFGMLVDKFGVIWMVAYDKRQ
jgi:PhnB protein